MPRAPGAAEAVRKEARDTVSDDDQTKYSGGNVHGPAHASPYPVSRLGAPVSLVDTARAIESASATVAMRTNAQLEHDESWTRVDEIEARDRKRAEIQGFVSSRLLEP